jgi:hypothetical protein
MALNFLPFLNKPVTKPTGYEPLATFTDKLASGAQNYHGLPIAEDPRPAFAGGGKGPRALLTKPIEHAPASRSDLPLPFSTVVYNANALHVPDLESIGDTEMKRRERVKMVQTAKAYVPQGKPGLVTLLEGEIAALEVRIKEKTASLQQRGMPADVIAGATEEDARILRELYNRRTQADAGVNPAYVNVHNLMRKNWEIPVEADVDVRQAWERADAAGLQGTGGRPLGSFWTARTTNAVRRHMVDANMPVLHPGAPAGPNPINRDAGIAPMYVGPGLVPALGPADDLPQPEGDAPGVPPGAAPADDRPAYIVMWENNEMSAEEFEQLSRENGDRMMDFTREELEALLQQLRNPGAGAGAGAGANPATPARPERGLPIGDADTPEDLTILPSNAKKRFDDNMAEVGHPYVKRKEPLPANTVTGEALKTLVKSLISLAVQLRKSYGQAAPNFTAADLKRKSGRVPVSARFANILLNRAAYFQEQDWNAYSDLPGFDLMLATVTFIADMKAKG